MKEECIFCKIIKGEISSAKVYEDDIVFAFNDISPKAPIHIIIIPKKHINSLKDIDDKDIDVLGHIQIVISKLAKRYPQLENGFRVVNNCGTDGGQTVFHLHYHLLGGRKFLWPAG
jgi:histidine triad (HIT) family protein